MEREGRNKGDEDECAHHTDTPTGTVSVTSDDKQRGATEEIARARLLTRKTTNK